MSIGKPSGINCDSTPHICQLIGHDTRNSQVKQLVKLLSWSGNVMLACLLQGPGKAILQDVSIPKLGQKDVLVRLEVAGICGTDVEKLEGGLGPGGILGHEGSGTGGGLGENVEGVLKGDRVVA